MDLPTEPLVRPGPASESAGRRGIALPSAMFALVAAGILAAGMFAFADLGAKATLNQERSTRAMHVAEAGLSHGVSLLRTSLRMHNFARLFRGADNFIPTADDGRLSFGAFYPTLLAADQIPVAGRAFDGGTYFFTITDDPADGDVNAATDLNGRVLATCRAVMADGSTAEVRAIVGSIPQPGFAADGNAAFGGGPQIGGPCGGAHANGNISSVGGGPTIGTQVSATGTVTGSWNKPDGTAAPQVPNADPIDIPDLNPADYCTGAQADFRLLGNGTATNGAGGALVPAIPLGWTWNPATTTWTATGVAGVPITPPAGTYCVTGNAYVQGSVGTAAAPRQMSVIASGSIRIEGTPVMRPDHDDGILALAGGDIYLAGNAAAGATNYSGLIYARAQCYARGNFVATGQVMCANNAQPAGATEWTVAHDIAGNFSINYDCSANVFNKRRVLYWYPTIGT